MSLRKLDLYILGHVLALTALVGLALMTIQSFLAFVADIGDIGEGRFGYADLFAYTALMLPRGLYLMLPVIAMLGTLMGLGVLSSQSELTAMRAASMIIVKQSEGEQGVTIAAGHSPFLPKKA